MRRRQSAGAVANTDISSLPYKTPWNFYREGMILPVFVCACLILPAGQLAGQLA